MKSKKIKSIIMLTIVLATAAVFTACNGNKPANIDLPAQFANIEIANTGGSQIVQFSATADWTVTVKDNTRASAWLTVSTTSGKAGSNIPLTLTAQPNTTDAVLSATVTITAGDAQKSFTVKQAAAVPIQLAVGDSFQGGIIAYIDGTGQHGLIAAPTDQIDRIMWYNGSYTVTGATDAAIGSGQSNTTAIVTTYGDGVYAAKMCDDLVIGDYSDWFLPSKDELNELFINRDLVGEFNTNPGSYYWSSTERNYGTAYSQNFNNGSQSGYDQKNNNYHLRAVRAF